MTFSPLRVEVLGPHHYRLFEPMDLTEDGELIDIVPEGVETDGASIPRCLWWLIGTPEEEYFEESVYHDYLTNYPEENSHVTRREADQMFFDHLKAIPRKKLPRWKVYAMWLGVRLGGWKSWNRARKRLPLSV